MKNYKTAIFRKGDEISNHSAGESKTNQGWCEAFADIRAIADEALQELTGRR